MFCSKCGNKNAEGAKFCNKCGAIVTYNSMANVTATSFIVGSSVLAKWSDGLYYPGKISEIKDDQALIHFDDGDISWVKLSEISDSEEDFEEGLTVGESVGTVQMDNPDFNIFYAQLLILSALVGVWASSWTVFLLTIIGLSVGVTIFKKFAIIIAVFCAISCGVVGWLIGIGLEGILLGIILAIIGLIVGFGANLSALGYLKRP